MKRRAPMKRSGPIKVDRAKTREWQDRSRAELARSAGPARSKAIAPRSKGKPPKVGTTSKVNPPDGFRPGVYVLSGGRCLVLGVAGSERGQFDPHHAIRAELIRTEARTTPALADYVYDPRLGVWLSRGVHFAHEYGPGDDDRIAFELLPARVHAIAAEMDGLVAGDRRPFAAYLDRTYPRRDPAPSHLIQ